MKSAIKLVTLFALIQVAAIPMVLGAADRVLEGKTIKVGPTGGVLTLPNTTDTLVGKNTTDTLKNKTIAAGDNTISGLTNSNLSGSAAITDANLATISTAGKVSNSATTATSANTASAIVARDSSGNFSAGTITGTFSGNLTGNVTGNVSGDLTGNVTGNVSGSAASFTGSLSGDVTGTQSSTSIANNVVSNSKLSTVSTGIIKGRKSSGTGNVEDLSAADATSILNDFVGDSGSGGTKGLVPAPGTGDAAAEKFLKADGSWATTPAGFSNPMTDSGDIIYGGSAGAATKLSGNTTTTKKVLSQTGTGSASAAPSWSQVDYSDIAGVLPSPGATTLGGVKSLSATTSNWINSIGTDGTPGTSQPAFTDISGTASISQGGTGQTSQQAAINALTGSQSSGKYLRSDGTNATLSSIQAGDVPTLNQNTTGTASNVTGTVAIANGGTGQTSKAAAFDALHPMTTTGDLIYASSGSTSARLPVGSSGQVIKSVGGVPTWATFSGGINYLSSNPDAEADTTGWATYADAAGTSPVDATGGSATTTWTRSTSSPLRGSGSFLLTKDAANRQGEGASYDFTIDSADQAKVISISFDYTVSSGTYADGDVTLYVYDVTNALVMQPAGYKVQSVTTGTMNKHIATFQTASNSTSYRLALHVATTSASAYTLKLDNFQVGPQTVQYGAPVTDWVAYTPSWTAATSNPAIGNGTLTGYWRRVGDTGYYRIQVKAGSTTTFGTGAYYFSIPHTMDLNKVGSNTNTTLNLGDGYSFKSGTNRYRHMVVYQSDTTVAVKNLLTVSGTNPVSVAGNQDLRSDQPVTWASGDEINLYFAAPITGWSSSVQMSNDTDTRVVAAGAHRNGSNQTGLAPNASTVQVIFNSIASSGGLGYDTHGTYDTGGTYLVPVTGKYRINAQVLLTGANVLASAYQLSVRTGSSSTFSSGTDAVWGAAVTPAAGAGTYLTVSKTLDLTAGTYLFIGLYGAGNNSASTLTMNGTANLSNVSFERISGPSTIAASETVAFKGTSANTSVGTTYSTISLTTEEFDTHNAYTSGVFTAPVSGKYRLSAQARAATSVSASTAANGTVLAYRINSGTEVKLAVFIYQVTAVSLMQTIGGTTTVSLNAGDTVEFRIIRDSPVSAFSLSGDSGTYGSIERIGN